MPDFTIDAKQATVMSDTGDLLEVKKLTRFGTQTNSSYYFLIPRWWINFFNNVVKRDGDVEQWVKFSYDKEDNSFTVKPLTEKEALQMSHSPPPAAEEEDGNEPA